MAARRYRIPGRQLGLLPVDTVHQEVAQGTAVTRRPDGLRLLRLLKMGLSYIKTSKSLEIYFDKCTFLVLGINT